MRSKETRKKEVREWKRKTVCLVESVKTYVHRQLCTVCTDIHIAYICVRKVRSRLSHSMKTKSVIEVKAAITLALLRTKVQFYWTAMQYISYVA